MVQNLKSSTEGITMREELWDVRFENFLLPSLEPLFECLELCADFFFGTPNPSLGRLSSLAIWNATLNISSLEMWWKQPQFKLGTLSISVISKTEWMLIGQYFFLFLNLFDHKICTRPLFIEALTIMFFQASGTQLSSLHFHLIGQGWTLTALSYLSDNLVHVTVIFSSQFRWKHRVLVRLLD